MFTHPYTRSTGIELVTPGAANVMRVQPNQVIEPQVLTGDMDLVNHHSTTMPSRARIVILITTIPHNPMARPRTVTVIEDLDPIETRYRGKPEQIRIRALRLLKEDPARTHREVAQILGLSKPTIDRWWGIYRRSGLEG